MYKMPEHVNIDGPVTNSQIAIGEHNIQLQNLNGCTVNISSPDLRPIWERSRTAASGKPRPPGLFLDRVTEIQLVQNSIQSFLPVNVSGPAGMGKSTLLKQLIHLLRPEQFVDGIHHLQGYQRKMDDLLQDLFSLFYTSNQSALPNRAQLQEMLQDIRALLLIDDMDLNPDEIQVVLDMVPNSMFVIVSTGQILQSGVRPVRLGGLPESEAATLFEATLGRSLDENERQIVCEISRILQGHPANLYWLAATAREDRLILSAVREKLRGMSVEGLFQESIQSLPDRQKKILAILTVVESRPLSLGHLASLLPGEPIRTAVNDLAARGLIQTQNQSSHISESFAGQIAQFWRLAQWEQAMTRYFVSWLAQNPSRQAIQEVRDALWILLEKAVQRSDWAAVISLGRALEPYFILSGYWQAWHTVLQYILEAARRLADRKLEGWALHQLGSRSLSLGARQQAASQLQQAAAIRKSIGDRAGLQVTRHNLSLITGVVPVTGASAGAAAVSAKPVIFAFTGIALLMAVGGSAAALAYFFTPGAPALHQPANEYVQPSGQYPPFEWQAVFGGSTYRIQVDDQADFSSPLYDQTVPGTSHVPNLSLPQGVYYWRVRANSESDRPGNWSEIRKFTVSLPVGVPMPLLPPDQFISTEPASPVFGWSSADNAAAYQLQVDDSPDFSSPVFDNSVSGTQFTPSSQLPQGKYSWRVRGTNVVGISGDWSSTSTFIISIPPAPVQLLQPANGSKLETTANPVFQWQTVTNAASYEIQVDDNPDFSSPQYDARQTGNNFPMPTPLAQGSYSWRVEAFNADGEPGGWSAAWSFIISIPPETPMLTGPANDSVQVLTDMAPLTWTAVAYAAHYELQMDDSPNFDSLNFSIATANAGFRLQNTFPQGVYFWRVRALNVFDTASGWSSPWRITISVPPAAPLLVSPSDGYQGSPSSTITFTWQSAPNAVQSLIQVDNTADFSSPEYQSSVSGTTITPGQYWQAGKYFWRVRAADATGVAGSWSAVWSFSVQLPAPVLISPGDNSIVNVEPGSLSTPPSGPVIYLQVIPTGTSAAALSFLWGPVPGAASYQIQIDEASNFGSPVIDKTLPATSMEIPGELYSNIICGEINDFRYQWRVRALDAAGIPGLWSSIWYVTLRVDSSNCIP